ncbi:DUF2341 domain-containing protein [Geobacter sp. DSM 9736]|uniref:DUF2341 domain-containing protein n=1 Tax=Geobacter sp. DSM 9736 TaxID=1277350 RepID=UPI000B5128D0|nr:DUF2341 domain-containing protein [Geobacter sp. DSM 9736]SNB46001.1 Concanavalin A-like lectin/glucanases superfamily protein [Geobacter sp. DSM 9736]
MFRFPDGKYERWSEKMTGITPATIVGSIRKCGYRDWKSVLYLLLAAALILAGALPAAALNGGDEVWKVRDRKAGKQHPAASAVDSGGNVIVTGFHLSPGGSDEEFYTIKVRPDGTIAWRGTYARSGFKARAVALALDSENNVYVTGTTVGANNTDVVTIRYDAVQNTQDAVAAWTKIFDGGIMDSASSIAVHGDSLFVGGSSRYNGSESFLVLKYGKNGTLSWQIPNAGTVTVGKVSSLAAGTGGVAVTGQTWSGNDLHLKTVMYDAAGQAVLWQTSVQAPGEFQRDDSGLFIKLDSLGHAVVAGSVANGADQDMHTVKYCASSLPPCTGKNPGDILWSHTFDGGSEDEPAALAIDSTTDDVFVTGRTYRSDTGRFHAHTVRYRSAPSNPQTAWEGGGVLFSSGDDNTDIPTAMAVDESDALFVVGYTEDASANSDFRIIKYRKSNGAQLWTRTFSGTAARDDRAVGVASDPVNPERFYVTGYADETTPLEGLSAVSAGTAKAEKRVVDGTRMWSVNRWTNYYVMMTSGANEGSFRPILGNDATSLTVAYPFDFDIAAGDGYYIYDNDDLDFHVVTYAKGALNAPTLLSATPASNTEISLTWQDNNATAPSFRVERCTEGADHLTGCDFDNPDKTLVLDVGNVTTKTDGGLIPGRYYYYRVKAYDANGETHPSNTAHAVTQYLNLRTPGASEVFTYAGIAENDDYALSVATGPDGNPVVTGKSFFDPGGVDYYTLKLSREDLRNKLWSQRYDDSQSQEDAAMCLAVDRNNQIIVSGYAYMNNAAAGKYMNSIYTIKYKADAAPEPEIDPDLIDEWSHQYNGPGATDDRPVSIASATSLSGAVAVVGFGMHSSTNFSLGHDIYLIHYPAGGPAAAGFWTALPIDKGENDEPTAVTFDPAGNVIITGFMKRTGTRSDYDIYTAKFCGSISSGCPQGKNPGDLIWEAMYDGREDGGIGGLLNRDDQANDVAADEAGNIYVTGYRTNADGNWDYITVKYDASGVKQWDLPYDGPAGGDDEAVTVKVDPGNGEVVVGGNRLTDPGNNDFHVVRYSPAGSMVWARPVLRNTSDDDMIEMAIDGSGSVFVTGTTTSGGSDTEILTVKIDRSGTLLGDGTMFKTVGREDKSYDVTTNYLGEAFVAGITRNGLSNADYVVVKIAGDAVVGPYPLEAVPGYASVTLSWPPVAVTKGGIYHLQRQEGACENNVNLPTALPDQAGSVTSYADTDPVLRQQTAYCYSIRHDNGGVLSPWVRTTVVTATPPAPTPVTAAASGTAKVTLVWTPAATGHTGFEIWRCMDSSPSAACSDFTLLQAVSGTAAVYDDESVCPGSTYRYKVRTTGPGWTSLFSETVGAVPPTVDNIVGDPGFEAPDPFAAGQGIGWTYVGGSVATDITFDPAVYHGGARSLGIDAVGTASQSGIKQYVLFAPGGKYRLSAWMKSAAAAGKVKCDSLDGSSFSIANSGTTTGWEEVTQSLAVTTSVPVTGSRLRCFALAGAQGYLDDLQLSPVYDLTATRVSEARIDIAWVDSAFDETGYKIERCADSEGNTPCGNFVQVTTVGANVTSYRDGGLAPGTTFRYRIRPYKTFSQVCSGTPGWDGAFSNTAFASTTTSSPVLTASAPGTTHVSLSWTDPTLTETEFQVVRCTGSTCNMTPLDPGFPRSLIFNSTAYADTTACNGTTYNYWVKAVNEGLSMDGDGRWTRRIPVSVANPLANHQTKLVVPYQTGMNTDFSDIRLYNETLKVEVPYWVESMSPGASGSATIWFKMPSIGDSIYLYYGNSSAAAPNGSGSSVFDFFDDFNGSSLGQWSVSINGAATAVVSGGVVTLDSTANPAKTSYLTISKAMTPPYRVEARINNTSAYLGQGLIRNRMLTSGIGTDTGIFDVGGNYLQAYNASGTTKQVPADQYVRVRADHLGGTANTWSIHKEDGTQIYSTAYTGTPTAIHFSEGDGGGGNGKISVDWVFARRYAQVEPVATLGTPAPADSNDAGFAFDFTWDGLWSKPAAGAAQPAPTQVTTAALPAAPALTSVSRRSEAEIEVAWTFPTGKDQEGFKVDRCTDAECASFVTLTAANADVATATAGTWKYTDSGLAFNTTYWYRVRAYRAENAACNGGKGFWETASSGILSATTDLTAPAASTDPAKTFSRITTACEDVRIVDSDGSTKLNYYIAGKDDTLSQCNRTATKFTVKLDIPAGGKNLKLYYGNLMASSSATTGSNIFDFFDDFDNSSIDQGKWTVTDGTGFSVAGSKLRGTNTTGRLTSKSSFGPGYRLQARVKTALLPTNGFVPLGVLNYWYENTGWLIAPGSLHYSNNNAYTRMADTTTPPAGTALTDAMIFDVVLKSTTTAGMLVNDIEQNRSITYWGPLDLTKTGTGINARPIVLGRRYDSDSYNNQTYSAEWEWLRVRKHAAMSPAAALGEIEPAGAPYTLSGEPGSWRFRRPVTVTYPTGNPALSGYQLDIVADTTSLATDRNTITWTDTTSTETGFAIERCTGEPCGSFTLLPASIAPNPGVGQSVSYVDRDLQLDSPATPVRYCYRVKALNPSWPEGGTGYSDTVCLTTTQQAAPAAFTAVPGTSQVALSWTDNTVGETGFKVERCKDPDESTACSLDDTGVTAVILVPPNDNALSTTAGYSDTNLCSGIYRYRISAYKNNPDGTSWVLGPTVVTGETVSTGLPTAPLNVVATRISEQQIQVTWKDTTPDEAGFEVWRCSGAADCTTFAKLPVSVAPLGGTGGTVTYNDNYFLVPGTTYRYMIKSYTTGGCGTITSAPSLPNSAPPPNGPDHATATVNPPASFSATASNTTQVDLAWNDTTIAESGFAIKRCPSLPVGAPACSTAYVDVATTNAGAVSYSDVSACSGTTYAYLLAPVEHPSMPFGNSGGQVWRSKSSLVITDFQPNFLTQVRITKGADKDMQDDFRDIRFLDRDNGVELPYWIQSTTGTGSSATAIVWFRTGGGSNVDLYYGNPSATSASNKDAVFGTGLSGYWPFEENAGTLSGSTADRSGSGKNATLYGFGSGNGIVSTGRFGNGLKTDGVNDGAYVADTTGSVFDVTDQVSIELWYQYQKSPDWARLVSKTTTDGGQPWEMFGIWLDNSTDATPTNPQQRVYFGIGSVDSPPVTTTAPYYQTSTGPRLTPGQWYHLVGRYDSSTGNISLFVNGVEYGSVTVSSKPKIVVNNGHFYMGGRGNNTGNWNPLKGIFDEVRFYSRALTNAEIAARYAAALPAVAIGARTGTGAAGPSASATVVTPVPGNLVANSDFESTWTGWTGWPDSTGLSSDAAVYVSGRASLKQSKNLAANTSRNIYQSLSNLKPGGKYILTGYMKAALAGGGRAWCGLANWATSVNWGSDTTQFQILASDASKNNQGWIGFSQEIDLPLTAPGGGSISQLNLECGVSTTTAGTQTAWFDAIQLVPSPPVLLTATRFSESSIDLGWNDLFTDKTGFNIYRCMDSGSECTFGTTPYKQVSGVTYRDTGLSVGQTYRYKIAAYKSVPGCPWESPASNTAYATTTQIAPTVTVLPSTATSLQLLWNRTTSNETGFNIERCTNSNCENYVLEYSNVSPSRLIDSKLKARFPFNGNLNDSSGSGLSLSSLHNYTPTYEDGALVRNSVYNLQSQTTDILNTDTHTIEFDIKFRSTVCSTCTYKIFGFNAGGSDRSPGIWLSGGNRIFWRYDPGNKGVNIGVDADGGTPFTVGTWYRIRGVKSGSNFRIYVDDRKVADINSVPAVKTAGQAMLEFGPSWADILIKNFSIYNSSDDPSLVTFTDNRLCPDTWYNYRVSAVKQGEWQGPASDPRGEMTPHFEPPVNLLATPVSDVQADLAWQANARKDQTAFVLKKCICVNPADACTQQECGDPVTIPNVTSYSSTGLIPETTYAYHVAGWRATEYCNAEHGIISDYTSIMADPGTGQPKFPVTYSERAGNLTATALNPFKVQLNWYDESNNEEGFIVETKIWNGRWVPLKKISGIQGEHNLMKFIDTIAIEPLKKYVYRVRAFRGAEISPPGNEAAVTYTYPGGGTISTTPSFTGGDKSTCPCDTGKILVNGVCAVP